MIVGIIGGLMYFIRLQSRLNRFTQLFPSNQVSQPSSVLELHSLVEQSTANENGEESDD
jgi:hypothetical protein